MFTGGKCQCHGEKRLSEFSCCFNFTHVGLTWRISGGKVCAAVDQSTKSSCVVVSSVK